MGIIWTLIVGALIGAIAGALTKKADQWAGLPISLQDLLDHTLVKLCLAAGV